MNFPVSAYKYYKRANRIFRGNDEFCTAGFQIFVKSPPACVGAEFSWGRCFFRVHVHLRWNLSFSCPIFWPNFSIQRISKILQTSFDAIFFGIWRIMDSNFRRSSHAGADLHIFRANGLVEFEHKSQKTRFHTIFVAFILRLAELFFLAGCAEPRCGDFKELNSNFKETHVFPWAKADRDRKLWYMDNMFPSAGNMFPLAENVGARGAAP